MPRLAKAYIALVLCCGAAVLLVAARLWSSANLAQFLTLLGFVAFSATLKIRIPGVESTVSPSFIFLVLAMVSCSFSEVVAIALVAGLVQSLWAAKRPRLVQIAFSAAALVLSAGVAFEFTRLLLGASASNSPVIVAVLAGGLYLPLNTALVAAVIGLAEGKSLLQVARVCCESIFPYFAGGIVFAGLISSAYPRATAWNGAVALFPMVVLGYLYLMSKTRSVALAPIQSDSTEDEELVGAGSYRSRR